MAADYSNTANVLDTDNTDTAQVPDDIFVIVASSDKRSDYLSWREYFMSTAFLASLRSKDPATRVGACIVNRQLQIVGIGYNGMPRGCPDDKMPWGKSSPDRLFNKHLYVCHAEMNAILNKNSADVENCVLYSTLFPCNECSKIIIQSGIKEVVHYSDKHRKKPETIAAKRMLAKANVETNQFIPTMERLVIDFTEVNK